MGICGMAATSAGWFYGTLTCPCQPSQPSQPASQPATKQCSLVQVSKLTCPQDHAGTLSKWSGPGGG